MVNKPIWIKHAAQLATLASNVDGPRSKTAMSDLIIIEDGSVWIESGVIKAVGTTDELGNTYRNVIDSAEIIDASNSLVTPGLVDPHTHVVYGGSREREFEMRLQGSTYIDIMNKGGGIHATTNMTREATEQELIQQAIARLDSFLEHGVTTIEGKSGYGLNLETELKQLKVIKELQQMHSIDLVATFMGAHAVPKEFKGREEEYVDHIIYDMLPAIAQSNLAQFIDVFVKKEFSPLSNLNE